MKLINKFPNNIKNVIFDFGGVIMDINIGKTIQAFEALHVEGWSKDDIISSHKKFLLDLELGLITPDEFIHALYEEYPAMKNVGADKVWEAWNALLLGYDPQRIELIEKIRKNYKLFVLSNTNLPHRVRFKQMFREQFKKGFGSLFDKQFYSDEMHLRKPDLKIYNEVIEDTGIKPEETLFIDDNELNITYAKQTGLIAYHLTGGEKITDLFE